MTDIRMDWERQTRTGTAEAVFCASKTAEQLVRIIGQAGEAGHSLLMTRLEPTLHANLVALDDVDLDYDPVSRTAIFGPRSDRDQLPGIMIVAAGTSDAGIVGEVARTLEFHGFTAPALVDVGVAGLWRLMEHVEEIRKHRVLIAIAGMEGALFSVLAGLVEAPVVAVPAPGGYGVSEGGHVALNSALASCSAGITVVNIGNGFGAACAAIRMLKAGAD